MLRNIFSNKIEITCGIHESLYILPHKNHHESLSVSMILVFCLTMTWIRLIHYSDLCSSYIGPGLFVLLSIARFLLTFRLFVVFSFTIGAKNLFFPTVFTRWADGRSITLLRLSRMRRCRTSTRWQRWFRLTIKVGSELLCNGNQTILCFWYAWLFADFLLHQLLQPFTKEQKFYHSWIVGFIPNLCFESIESS